MVERTSLGRITTGASPQVWECLRADKFHDKNSQSCCIHASNVEGDPYSELRNSCPTINGE